MSTVRNKTTLLLLLGEAQLIKLIVKVRMLKLRFMRNHKPD